MDTLLALAVLPVAALLYYIWKKDPVEKEPSRLLVVLLLFGVVSTIPAILLEQMGSYLILDGWAGTQTGFLIAENFFVVAISEELCKYVFLKWRTWNNPAFDYVFDGIVYAVFVSLGFAVAENISYVFEYGFGTAVVRAFTAIPGHCVFAVFMGYFYGEAKLARQQGSMSRSIVLRVAALVVPMACHGAYDFLASIDGDYAIIAFFVLLLGMVAIGMRLVKRESALARRIYDQ